MTEQPDTGVRTTFVDLFCGAGGLSWGFRSEGFEERLALDHARYAIRTHRANFASASRVEEISLDTDLPDATVIVGGPPCQSFSSAGLKRNGDRRSSLVSVFADLVVRARPEAFVFENVEGFLTADGGQRVVDLLEPLVGAGYRIHLRKINAANYGVPQHRKRVIAIGGLGWTPNFPEPTHFAFGAPGAELIATDRPPCPTLADALAGLPPASEKAPGSPQGHHFKQLASDLLRGVSALAPGQTMRDLPHELRHQSYRRRANRRVRDGTPTERRGGAPSGLRRLRSDEPSKAITGGARSEFIHPHEDRRLTLRECARIQTFPDDFVFDGTLGQQGLQIGNAVPPRLAKAIAASLREDLHCRRSGRRAGELVSFIPTNSAGMSPALQQTTQVIAAAFPGGAFQLEDLPLWG